MARAKRKVEQGGALLRRTEADLLLDAGRIDRASAPDPDTGLMTISPVANVKSSRLPDQLEDLQRCQMSHNSRPLNDDEAARVVGYGIDTLVVALDIQWREDVRPALFDLLDTAKRAACEAVKQRRPSADRGEPVTIHGPSAWGAWDANVHGFGVNGYEWMVSGRGMTWRMGGWRSPCSKPSLIVELGSELCWRHGPRVLLLAIRRIIENNGGQVVTCKVSRCDMAVDVLVREDELDASVAERMVCRASQISIYTQRRKFNAVAVGGPSSPIKCRIYDKPLEIELHKNAKDWFFEVWGMADGVPEGHKVYRVEYQLRREKIKETGHGDAEDWLLYLPNMWKYLSAKWLRLADDPKKHHTMQKVLEWWQVVQAGWWRAEGAKPVRMARPVKAEARQLARQAVGCWSSLIAAEDQETTSEEAPSIVELDKQVGRLLEVASDAGRVKLGDEVGESIKRKRAKYRKMGEKYKDAMKYRALLRADALRLVSEPVDRVERVASERADALAAELWHRCGVSQEIEQREAEEAEKRRAAQREREAQELMQPVKAAKPESPQLKIRGWIS